MPGRALDARVELLGHLLDLLPGDLIRPDRSTTPLRHHRTPSPTPADYEALLPLAEPLLASIAFE